MKNLVFPWQQSASTHVAHAAKQCVVSLVLLFGASAAVQAAPLVTLEGETNSVRDESRAGVKLSVLDWSTAEEQERVLSAFRRWQQDGDSEAFLAQLHEENTRGYLFTGEVTGYSAKYAVEDSKGNIALLIVPGLKTKNRYLWQSPPSPDAPPFTLLQLEWSEPGEAAALSTSLGAGIRLSEDGGHLVIDGNAQPFAELQDAKPYYLKS